MHKDLCGPISAMHRTLGCQEGHHRGLRSVIVFGCGRMRRRCAASIAALLLAAGTPDASASEARGTSSMATASSTSPTCRRIRAIAASPARRAPPPAGCGCRRARCRGTRPRSRRSPRAHGVSPELITAVMRDRVGFRPGGGVAQGRGRADAAHAGTAAALGVVDRFDPRENISGGVRHLRYLLDRYQGRVALALAAYNAGEGVVDTYRGIPPYPETQQYVRRVLREAGLGEGAGEAPQTLYRYRAPTTRSPTAICRRPRPRQGPRRYTPDLARTSRSSKSPAPSHITIHV